MNEKRDDSLISIIVPIYNAELFLERCICSITNQTYSNLEIILVDDGSTDHSGSICEGFARKDSRIKVIHKENGGQASARNIGLENARGQYIGFVDADDYVAFDMYELLYKSIQFQNNTIAMCGRYNVNERDNSLTEVFVLEKQEKWTREEALRRFLTWKCIDGAAWDKLFPQYIIGNNRFPVEYVCEDIPFIYQILKKCDNVIHIASPKYYYLQRSGSTSHPKEFTKRDMGVLIYNKKIREDVINHNKSLDKEADYFYYSRIPFMYKLVGKTLFKNKTYKRYLRQEIRNSLITILQNPLFNNKQKVIEVLIAFSMYEPSAVVYYMIKEIAEWKKR
jgi:glycosyltransferase involved in cell wall biosynthesis